MSANNKRDDFTREDLLSVGQNMGVKKSKHIIEEITEVISRWDKYATDSGVKKIHKEQIDKNLQLL